MGNSKSSVFFIRVNFIQEKIDYICLCFSYPCFNSTEMIQKYIDQLVEDLQKAADMAGNHDPLQNQNSSVGHDLQDHFAQVEEYLHGPMYKLSKIVGIETAMLPADDLLSDEQTALLASEMESLLKAYNFYPDFPQDTGMIVPPRLRYRAMRSHWESKQTIMSFGESHLEFCSYDEKDCPFPGYCNSCSSFGDHHSPDTDSKSEDLEFIPSIFNYCDRWCEKCSFTAKCRTFAMERELTEIGNSIGKSPEEKIQDIEDMLSGSFPKGNHDDSDSYDNFDPEDSEDPNDLFSVKNKSEHHPLVLATHSYSECSHKWLKTITRTCRTEFTLWLATGIADQILDAIETVSWYHFFVYPKIRRALSGHFEMEEDEFAAEDMHGSAKIALIAIDRSIAAFTFLGDHLPSYLTEINGFIKQLNGLRHIVEMLFPDARGFIRPGLDE
jgi:hypothetical protein